MRGKFRQNKADEPTERPTRRRFVMQLGAAVLVTGALGLLLGSPVTRAVTRLTVAVLSLFQSSDPTHTQGVGSLVEGNRHLLWLPGVSLFASSAVLWGRWRRNFAVLVVGLATFAPLIVTVFVLLAIAQLRGGSQTLTNAAGLVSLLIPGLPMFLIFLRQVRTLEKTRE